jgi:hypothetical protein
MYSDDKECGFEAKAADEQIRLLNLHIQLERDTGYSFTGLSISESIGQCLTLGHANRAGKMQKDFKVPDRRFWWIKVKALVATRNWEGLDSFCRATPKFDVAGIIEMLIRFESEVNYW